MNRRTVLLLLIAWLLAQLVHEAGAQRGGGRIGGGVYLGSAGALRGPMPGNLPRGPAGVLGGRGTGDSRIGSSPTTTAGRGLGGNLGNGSGDEETRPPGAGAAASAAAAAATRINPYYQSPCGPPYGLACPK